MFCFLGFVVLDICLFWGKGFKVGVSRDGERKNIKIHLSLKIVFKTCVGFLVFFPSHYIPPSVP